MKILLSNDDGFMSSGINSLKKELSDLGRIFMVAPDKERSAASHKITISHPIRINKIENDVYITDANPADCIKVAFLQIVKEKIDLVISGINIGPNMGTDVFYSGTVAAAREGAFNGVAGIAFSLDCFDVSYNFTYAASIAKKIIVSLKPYLKPGLLLNVNFPLQIPYKGIKFTFLGERIYNEKLIENKDPMGRPFYWIGGDVPTFNPIEGSDFEAVHEGYVSITPLILDTTNHSELEELKNIQFSI